MTTKDIMNKNKGLKCGSCDKKVIESNILVDDGITENVYHHVGCY